jgi:hypothetical protein
VSLLTITRIGREISVSDDVETQTIASLRKSKISG